MYSGGKGSSAVGWSLRRTKDDPVMPASLLRLAAKTSSGHCLGHTCHLPVLWAPDGASGLHEVESVGLARVVGEVLFTLVHHFSVD